MSELQSSTASDTPTDFLTVDQVAALLGVSVKTIRRWVQNGDLAHFDYDLCLYKGVKDFAV